jgi:hemerythrin
MPFEIIKETLLNTITNRNTKKNHEKLFEKVNLELKTSSKPYQENRKIEYIMKELCLL